MKLLLVSLVMAMTMDPSWGALVGERAAMSTTLSKAAAAADEEVVLWDWRNMT